MVHTVGKKYNCMVCGVQLDWFPNVHEMSNQQSEKQCFPNTTQNWIAFGKLVATYNFTTSLFCTTRSSLRTSLDDGIWYLAVPKLYMLTSIVLTNSRLPSPWVTKAVLTHTEVLVHEEFFQNKTGAVAMAILRGDIPMMGCISTNDSTVFTCAGCMRCFFENVKTIA